MIKTILTAAFVVLLATEVQAGCFDPETIEEMAKAEYNEQVTHVATTSAGEIVRLYQNREAGTWTLTVIMPNGRLECTLTDGEGWQEIAQGDPA